MSMHAETVDGVVAQYRKYRELGQKHGVVSRGHGVTMLIGRSWYATDGSVDSSVMTVCASGLQSALEQLQSICNAPGTFACSLLWAGNWDFVMPENFDVRKLLIEHAECDKLCMDHLDGCGDEHFQRSND